MGHIITSSLFYGAVGAALIEALIALYGMALMRMAGRGEPEFGDED